MENNKIIKPSTLMKNDDHYLLVLSLNDDDFAYIDLTDENQNDLDDNYAKIIQFVILNNCLLEFSKPTIHDSISEVDDLGVIAIVNEYIPMLNSEIETMYNNWDNIKIQEQND